MFIFNVNKDVCVGRHFSSMSTTTASGQRYSAARLYRIYHAGQVRMRPRIHSGRNQSADMPAGRLLGFDVTVML